MRKYILEMKYIITAKSIKWTKRCYRKQET